MKNHNWIKCEDGEIDVFAYEEGAYHNGPKCSICGFGFCHHCYPEEYKTSCPCPSLGSNDSKLDSSTVAFVNSLKSSLGVSKKVIKQMEEAK